jgi:hypothetical protein
MFGAERKATKIVPKNCKWKKDQSLNVNISDALSRNKNEQSNANYLVNWGS